MTLELCLYACTNSIPEVKSLLFSTIPLKLYILSNIFSNATTFSWELLIPLQAEVIAPLSVLPWMSLSFS